MVLPVTFTLSVSLRRLSSSGTTSMAASCVRLRLSSTPRRKSWLGAYEAFVIVLPRTEIPSEPPLTQTALSGMSANVLSDRFRFLACRTSTATPATLSNVFDEISAFLISTDLEWTPVFIALRGSSGTPS